MLALNSEPLWAPLLLQRVGHGSSPTPVAQPISSLPSLAVPMGMGEAPAFQA